MDADKIRNKGPSNDALDQTVTRNTTEAIARGVFGAPSYVFENGDVVWGQDRLQFVEMKLASMACRALISVFNIRRLQERE